MQGLEGLLLHDSDVLFTSTQRVGVKGRTRRCASVSTASLEMPRYDRLGRSVSIGGSASPTGAWLNLLHEAGGIQNDEFGIGEFPDTDFRIYGLGIFEFTVLVVSNPKAVGDCEFPSFAWVFFIGFMCESGVTEWACTLFG